MKNTLDAIKYGLETLKVTPKELFSLVESSKGYDGDNYNRWLANEIIVLAEKDGIGYSHLLAKWFNLMQGIIEEYADDSVKDCYNNQILNMVKNSNVYTLGLPKDNPYGIDVSAVEWGSRVDMPYNYDFVEALPDSVKNSILSNEGVTFFFRFNPKETIKKSDDLQLDAKLNQISLKSRDALLLYRICTIARAFEDTGINFKFVFMTNTEFLFNVENAELIKYFLSYFHYSGFVVDSKELYEGSFTSEEYAICECVLRDGSTPIQDGFMLSKAVEVDGEIQYSTYKKRYSKGEDMLSSLMRNYSSSTYQFNVPMLDSECGIVGITKGVRGAYGYLCKRDIDRGVILYNYPVENSKYIAITEENLLSIIAYFGVSQAMDGIGLFLSIDEIIDGHSEFDNLVGNCIPIFLFDVANNFADLGERTNKSGKVFHLDNKFSLESKLVGRLLDTYSVYFSYESKELMDICKKMLEYYDLNADESRVGYTFADIIKECCNISNYKQDGNDFGKFYSSALVRCKDFVGSLYRRMYM